MIYRILLVLSILLCGFNLASGQEHIEKRYSIFFRVGDSKVDRAYNNNDRTLDMMVDDIKATLDVDGFAPDSLLIYASASPEGSVLLNERLARERANATKNYVLGLLPQLKEAEIKTESRPNDWSGVILTLRRDETIPYCIEILKILLDPRIPNKEAALRKTPQAYAVIRDGMCMLS